MNDKKVSVIIPIYNSEKYLRQCLESVVNQTLKEIEIICVDDGSTDNSANILEEYRNRDKRISVINGKHKGAGLSRNDGILVAQGTYVIFLDSDDTYPEAATLSKLYSNACAHNALICGGSFSVIDRFGKIHFSFSQRNTGYCFQRDEEISYSDYQFDYGFHRFMFNREFLIQNDIRFPDYRFYEDPPFLVRAMNTAGSFFAIHDVVYRYLQTKKDITSSKGKMLDLMQGLTDNLVMSQKCGLNKLHQLTVQRCVEEYWEVLQFAERSSDAELIEALRKLNGAVNLSLGGEAEAPVNVLSLARHANQYSRLRRSYSYRIGRMITWLPRKACEAYRKAIDTVYSKSGRLL